MKFTLLAFLSFFLLTTNTFAFFGFSFNKTTIKVQCAFSCHTEVCRNGKCKEFQGANGAEFLSDYKFLIVQYKSSSSQIYSWKKEKFVTLDEIKKSNPSFVKKYNEIIELESIPEELKEACNDAISGSKEERLCVKMVKNTTNVSMAIEYIYACKYALSFDDETNQCINLAINQNIALSTEKIKACGDAISFTDETLKCINYANNSQVTTDIENCNNEYSLDDDINQCILERTLGL